MTQGVNLTKTLKVVQNYVILHLFFLKIMYNHRRRWRCTAPPCRLLTAQIVQMPPLLLHRS